MNGVQASEEVRRALDGGTPVVALESAVLTHGLPHPHNVEIIRCMQRAVRESGSMPAVIGVVDGEVIAGLNDEQVQRLGSPGTDSMKISTRDLGWAMATKASGGTTVAATLIAARQRGIRVFATGGIGGVHRGWPQTLDISADLEALATCPCGVVCSGAKAILDVSATLEALESRGIPVLGYRTDSMPQFYSRGSDVLRVPHRAEDVETIALTCTQHWRISRPQAVVVANPVPAERAIAQQEMDALIERAVSEAEARGVRGAMLTPFLLDYLAGSSGGEALHANLALLESNARLAGEIAIAMSRVDSD